MWNPNEYRLLDFGQGRKLESFGGRVVDRPCPAAFGFDKRNRERWEVVDLAFDGPSGPGWSWSHQKPTEWKVRHDKVVLELEPTPFGHLGIFPEQSPNWDWMAELFSRFQSECAPADRSTNPQVLDKAQCLNLFAYTGGTTLAMAAAGGAVVHIDASRPSVQWARRNAESSQLVGASIRWIVEDAAKFVRRELKRGRRYDFIALDPPSYGHGPEGEVWNLARDLKPLLSNCFDLLSDRAFGVLLTGHSDDEETIKSLLRGFQADCERLGFVHQFQRAEIESASGDRLDFGYSLRWSRSTSRLGNPARSS